jgi:hypothetical protein
MRVDEMKGHACLQLPVCNSLAKADGTSPGECVVKEEGHRF